MGSGSKSEFVVPDVDVARICIVFPDDIRGSITGQIRKLCLVGTHPFKDKMGLERPVPIVFEEEMAGAFVPAVIRLSYENIERSSPREIGDEQTVWTVEVIP